MYFTAARPKPTVLVIGLNTHLSNVLVKRVLQRANQR